MDEDIFLELNEMNTTIRDKIITAIKTIREGRDIKEVSRSLSWNEFEIFASVILAKYGYNVYKAFRINRLEIDLLAIDNEVALAIDCKHWKYNSISSIKRAVDRQIKRAELLYNSKRFNIKYVVPVILTLYESIPFLEDVPIVPIDKFVGFIREFKGHLDSLRIIPKE